MEILIGFLIAAIFLVWCLYDDCASQTPCCPDSREIGKVKTA